MVVEVPEDRITILRSQIDGWLSDLEALRRNPSAKKFTELRREIDDAEAGAFLRETDPRSLPNALQPFDPYDAYDAFEFAHDLAGQEISIAELSSLEGSRFPEISEETRRLMIRYLMDNGVAEVAQTSSSGIPTAYRFGALGNGGTIRMRKRLGIPDNELSALKAEDLDDALLRTRETAGRYPSGPPPSGARG